MTDQTIQTRIDALMKGSVDLHIHSGPSLHPRKIDHMEALKQADAAGMRAILLKDHYYPTMPVATLLNNNMGCQTEVLSAIVMNHPLGGFNPSAVDYALKQGAKIVWMPTAHAENHVIKTAKDLKGKFPENTKKTVEAAGLRLVDNAGVVLDKVKHILDLIAEADACVSAGHHHIDEAFPFYEEAEARGVKRMFLNHPTYVNAGSMGQVRELVSMGVMMEHSVCMFIPSTFQLFDDAHLQEVIAAAGVENTFFGSDLGQNGNPTPVEGMRAMIELLLTLGYSDADVRAMTTTNAARFAGLDA